MCVYLRPKFDVSSVILTSLERGGGGGGVILLKNETLRSQPRLGLNAQLEVYKTVLLEKQN